MTSALDRNGYGTPVQAISVETVHSYHTNILKAK